MKPCFVRLTQVNVKKETSDEGKSRYNLRRKQVAPLTITEIDSETDSEKDQDQCGQSQSDTEDEDYNFRNPESNSDTSEEEDLGGNVCGSKFNAQGVEQGYNLLIVPGTKPCRPDESKKYMQTPEYNTTCASQK